MWELNEIVIPKILAQWKDLAYHMRYTRSEVDAFFREGKDDHECCKKLFIDWINTDRGPEPKTYETLLKYIKEIENLKIATTVIEKELTEGKYMQIAYKSIEIY